MPRIFEEKKQEEKFSEEDIAMIEGKYQVPKDYCCGIMHAVMLDPVTVEGTNQHFEKEPIEQWLKIKKLTL